MLSEEDVWVHQRGRSSLQLPVSRVQNVGEDRVMLLWVRQSERTEDIRPRDQHNVPQSQWRRHGRQCGGGSYQAEPWWGRQPEVLPEVLSAHLPGEGCDCVTDSGTPRHSTTQCAAADRRWSKYSWTGGPTSTRSTTRAWRLWSWPSGEETRALLQSGQCESLCLQVRPGRHREDVAGQGSSGDCWGAQEGFYCWRWPSLGEESVQEGARCLRMRVSQLDMNVWSMFCVLSRIFTIILLT